MLTKTMFSQVTFVFGEKCWVPFVIFDRLSVNISLECPTWHYMNACMGFALAKE